MKKEQLDKIAKEVFKKHPEAEKCFITSDGQAFLSKNSAELHKNTNKKDKNLKLQEYPNPSVATSEDKGGKEGETEFPLTEKAVKALKLDDLKKMAEDLKIDIKELDTKAKLADAINELKSKS